LLAFVGTAKYLKKKRKRKKLVGTAKYLLLFFNLVHEHAFVSYIALRTLFAIYLPFKLCFTKQPSFMDEKGNSNILQAKRN